MANQHSAPEVFYMTLGELDLGLELVRKTDYDSLEEQLELCEQSHNLLTTEVHGLLEQLETQARALRAIHFNATSWHGTALDEGAAAKQRALNVIAAWALHPESVPEGIGDSIPASEPTP